MTLDTTTTRCMGAGCRSREGCERHRQVGRDQMAPHGTLPDWLPYTGTLRSIAGPCMYRIRPADAPARPLDGRRSDFPGQVGQMRRQDVEKAP